MLKKCFCNSDFISHQVLRLQVYFYRRCGSSDRPTSKQGISTAMVTRTEIKKKSVISKKKNVLSDDILDMYIEILMSNKTIYLSCQFFLFHSLLEYQYYVLSSGFTQNEDKCHVIH